MNVDETAAKILPAVVGLPDISAVIDVAAEIAGDLRCVELAPATEACEGNAKAFILSKIQVPGVTNFQPLSSIPAVIAEWMKIDTLPPGREQIVQAQFAVHRSYNEGVVALINAHRALGFFGAFGNQEAAVRLSHWDLTTPGVWSDKNQNNLITASAPGKPWGPPDFLKGYDDEAAAAVVPGLEAKWLGLISAWGIAWDGVVSLEAASMVAEAAAEAANDFTGVEGGGGFALPPAPPTAGPKKNSLLLPIALGLGALALIVAGKKR